MKNETNVSRAFGKQSVIFDKIYDTNPIVSYMRHLIRQEVLAGLHPNDHILEINAGTGSDALFFALAGFKVTALEISPEMVGKAHEKIRFHNLENQINFIQKSFEEVSQVEGTFDYVYSNFGGLNCTPDLLGVVHQLLSKLKPGGKSTLTILPPFTLWEKLHILKGDYKMFSRRKYNSPSVAQIEGVSFNCWYYKPKEIIDSLNGLVSDVSVTGLCIFVPPSFFPTFPNKFPRIFTLLKKLDHKVSKLPFFNSIGDYFMITYTKI